ncbi:MAG: SAM-dependent methyltransferase [Sphingomonas bacterium]|nr:SAM-dependent methyltransferase [Sphingomonas bacterium]
MAACNAYYYATRDPLGAAGDFTTAPEIHQMFGEMVGACLADCWHRAGAPTAAIYVELGPGRGTLAADALRVIGAGVDAHLVETSPRLREAQRVRVPGATFHQRIERLPPRPILLVANELLDALPVRQWVGDEQRLVMLDGDSLAFTSHGLIVENSPARDAAIATISAHLVRHGGMALLIDYGHAASAPGDTLQAVEAHRFADPLADPGEQDLTAHVDFEAVADVARQAGAKVTALATQSEWLSRIGIAQRADVLARANPDHAKAINSALVRLTAPDQMGDLFKVIAIHAPDWPAPAGFE